MIPAVLSVLALVLLAGLWMLSRAKRKYVPLLRDSHFLELAEALGNLKASGLAAGGRPIDSVDDPRILTTSAGVTVLYSTEELPEQEALLTHISLSHQSGYLAWAAGGRFVHQMLQQLGVPVADAAFAHSPAGVVHVAFLIQRAERSEFEQARVKSLLSEDVAGVKEQGGEFISDIMSSGLLLNTEEELLPSLAARHPELDFR